VATDTPQTEQTAEKPADPKQKPKVGAPDPLAKYKEADERDGGLTIYNFR